jgi:4-aminobutyrate aminotransferase-like enzyme
VQRHTDEFRSAFEAFGDEHPMVGDVRGDGFFYSLELVKDKRTKETFAPAERDDLIKRFIVPRARERGVYMRVDDRAETAAQFSPPLVAGPAELDEFLGVLRPVLDEAWDAYVAR